MPKASTKQIERRNVVETAGSSGGPRVSGGASPSGMGGIGGIGMVEGANNKAEAWAGMSKALSLLLNQQKAVRAEAAEPQASACSPSDAPVSSPCNPMVDAEQKAIAARGLVDLKADLQTGLTDGTITDAQQISERTGEFLAGLNMVDSQEVRSFMEEGVVKIEEGVLNDWVGQQEAQQQEALKSQGTQALASLIYGEKIGMDDDDFSKSYEAAKEAFLQGGGTDPEFTATSLEAFSAEALSNAGTEYGDALFKRAVSLAPDVDSILPTAVKYDELAIQNHELEDERARVEEDERQFREQSDVLAYAANASLEQLQELKARLAGQSEASGIVLGDSYADTVTQVDNLIKMRMVKTPDGGDRRTSKRGLNKLLDRIANEEEITLRDITNARLVNADFRRIAGWLGFGPEYTGKGAMPLEDALAARAGELEMKATEKAEKKAAREAKKQAAQENPEQLTQVTDEQFRAHPEIKEEIREVIIEQAPPDKPFNVPLYDGLQSEEAKHDVSTALAAQSAARTAAAHAPVTDPDDPFSPESLNAPPIPPEEKEPFPSPMDLNKGAFDPPVPVEEDPFKQMYEDYSNPDLAAEFVRKNARDNLERELAGEDEPDDFWSAPGDLWSAGHPASVPAEGDPASLGIGDYAQAAATGAGHGVWYQAPEAFLRAMRALAGESFPSVGEWAAQRLSAINDEYAGSSKDSRWDDDSLASALYNGFSSVAASLTLAAPAMAAAPKIAGASGIGFIAKLSTGGAMLAGKTLSANTIFALAQYDGFIDEALAAMRADNPDITRADVKEQVFLQAALSGGGTFTAGAFSDLAAGKLAGVFGIKPRTAQDVLGKYFRVVRNASSNMVTEVGEEIWEAWVDHHAREWAGLPTEGVVPTVKQNMGPALVAGALGGIQNTVLSAETRPVREKAESEIKAELQKVDDSLFKRDLDSVEAVQQYQDMILAGKSAPEAHATTLAAEAVANRIALDNGLDAAGLMKQITGSDFSDFIKVAVDADTSFSDLTDSGIKFLWNRLTPEMQQEVASMYNGREVNLEILSKDLQRYVRTGELPVAPPSMMVPGPEGASPVFDMMPADNSSEVAFEAMKSVMADSVAALEGNSKIKPSREAVEILGKTFDKKVAMAPLVARDQVKTEDILARYRDADLSDPKKLQEFMAESAAAVKFNFFADGLPTSLTDTFGQVTTALKPFTDMVHKNEAVRHDKETLAAAKERLENNPALKEFVDSYQSNLGNDAKVVEMGLTLKTMHAQLENINTTIQATQDPALAQQGLTYARLVNTFNTIYEGTRSEQGRALRAGGLVLNKYDKTMMRRLRRNMELPGKPEDALKWWQAYNTADTKEKLDKVMAIPLKERIVDAILEYYTSNMLFGIPTHVVNHLGNASQVVSAVTSRIAAAHGTKPVKGGVISGEAMAMLWAVPDGFRQWYEMLGKQRAPGTQSSEEYRALDAGTMNNAISGERFGLSREHGVISGGVGAALDLYGKGTRIPFKLLGGADDFWKTMYSKMETAALIHREANGDPEKIKELSKNPPRDIVKQAQNAAKELMFQGELGKMGKTINNIRILAPLTRLAMPFLKTPLNITKEAGKYTPGVAQIFQYTRDALNSRDPATRQVAQAQLTLGTMIWTTALGAAAAGMLTGPGPSDWRERQKLMATGWQPNSLRIGDKYYKLDRWDPFALILNGAAMLVDGYDSLDNVDLSTAAGQLFGQTLRLFTNRSYLSSASDLLQLLTEPEEKFPNFSKQMGRSFAPAGAFGRTWNNTFDPFMREEEGFWDGFRNSIPGLSDSLPIKYDFLGQPIERNKFIGPALVSPFQTSQQKGHPVYDEIWRLQDAGVSNVPVANKSVQRKKTYARMDAREFSEFKRIMGNEIKVDGISLLEKLTSEIASEVYGKMDDEQKGKHLNSIYQKYSRPARQTIVDRTPRLQRALNIAENGAKAILNIDSQEE